MHSVFLRTFNTNDLFFFFDDLKQFLHKNTDFTKFNPVFCPRTFFFLFILKLSVGRISCV